MGIDTVAGFHERAVDTVIAAVWGKGTTAHYIGRALKVCVVGEATALELEMKKR